MSDLIENREGTGLEQTENTGFSDRDGRYRGTMKQAGQQSTQLSWRTGY